jgi:hypothetical protein
MHGLCYGIEDVSHTANNFLVGSVKQIMNSMTLSSTSEEFHRCLKLLQQLETSATLGLGLCLKVGLGSVGRIAAFAFRHGV